MNTQILRQLLTPVSLRPDISTEDVIETFRQFQDFINIRYQMTTLSSHTFEEREENCLKSLNILLYGVIQRKEPENAKFKLAIPATLALLAKAIYNLVDTAYIGMLHSDIALTAVGVTVPLLLIMVSIENIFAAGAAVLAGRQLGAKDRILFLEPLMRAFGASDTSLPLAKDYAFWMFIAALANLPAQSMNCAARAESSVKISSIAVITGALLNVILESIFMFDLGLNMGVEGASLATTVSQFVPFFIMTWFSLDVTW